MPSRAPLVAVIVVGAVVVGLGITGLVLLLSGQGTGHVLWTRLETAPLGAGEMGADGFDEAFLGKLRNASAGEGDLLITGSYDAFWEDVRAAGGVETQEGCLAVTIEAIPVEFCEGPLV